MILHDHRGRKGSLLAHFLGLPASYLMLHAHGMEEKSIFIYYFLAHMSNMRDCNKIICLLRIKVRHGLMLIFTPKCYSNCYKISSDVCWF